MMVPLEHSALVVTRIGSPVTLVTDRPRPTPAANQILLKVHVASLNPVDQLSRDKGLFIDDNLPAVLADDVVGEVVTSRSGKFRTGDIVMGQSRSTPGSVQNGLQEYATLDADFCTNVPGCITADEAATIPTNIIASAVGLFDKECGLGIPAPWMTKEVAFDAAETTILIIGGGSNCGRFAVQLASMAGLGQIVVVGGAEDQLKSYGATVVLSRHGPMESVLERILYVTGEDLVYVLDAVNDPAGQILGIDALSEIRKGKFARLNPGRIDASKVRNKSAKYELIDVFGSSHARPHLCKPFWVTLPQYLERGLIKPGGYAVVDGLRPEPVNAVLDAYRDGLPVQKTHVHIRSKAL